ncbi:MULTISPECIES: hypothetical protein [Thermotoga]|jgi:sulfur carrier protein ThiS|uniref:Uncharacterized protein n=2 Tax=Thermotoga petrophila TaxID=93929 RepID=D2C4L2_THEP2|nr:MULTISPECIES: hypothetical protein [Thermotoga]KUK23380.1 MAG: Uncharacterized protein XD57_0515 [Thermotoga petrophila]KUK33850.1 MAG: Uncharacterized protein XD64_0318 [Thermotoga sp. 47_83]MBZ4662042.1 hypothetical protein [Thermotoga sp.]ACB09974.1 conserved hypothetical protein [Thermotoga sp. RQ2]ADA67666.1 conserved hypothetical protein [Thermotoga petrophila RKU-10]
MKVIVNGEEIVVEGVQTLGELLNRVRENKENLVVKRIVIDHEEQPLSSLEDLKQMEINEEMEIELELSPLRDFLLETIEEVLRYIKRVKPLLGKVADAVVAGTTEGYRSINDLAEGLNAMENVRMNTVRITGINSKELGLKVEEENLVRILTDFVNALQSKDLVKIADLIDGELKDVFEYYEEFFKRVEELLQKEPS